MPEAQISARFDWDPYASWLIITPQGRAVFVVANLETDETVHTCQLFGAELPHFDASTASVVWANAAPKCALFVENDMFSVFDPIHGISESRRFRGEASEPIVDPVLLADLPLPPIGERAFCKARVAYWKTGARRLGDTPTPDSPSDELTSGFLVSSKGPGALYGVFENTPEDGNLYVFDSENSRVIRWLQVHVASSELNLSPEDVAVVWTDEGDRVGVVIDGGLRAIIDLHADHRFGIRMRSRATKPIRHVGWLRGFQWWEKGTGETRVLYSNSDEDDDFKGDDPS